MTRLSTIVGCAVLLMAGCAGERRPEDTIVLQLNWRADAQHGGFYAALEHGEYAAEGLKVEIVQSGPGMLVIPKLVMGRVDFAISNSDQILQARQQEADIVGVMAPLQDSPRCIIVHQSSGITQLDQLKDMTLAMNEGRTFAMFLKQHLELDGVRIVPYSGSIAKFVLDQDFAQQGYVFSEPILMRREGADPRPLMLSEVGFNPYTSVVATRRSTLEDRPDVVRRFVAASRRGWQRYLESPEAANQAIHRVNPDMDIDSLREAAQTITQLCVPDGFDMRDLGTMTNDRWLSLAERMRDIGVIDSDPATAAKMAWADVISSTSVSSDATDKPELSADRSPAP